MTRRFYLVVALVLAAPAAGLAGGMPEPEPFIPLPVPPIIVQSSDALSPSGYTAHGRFATSSGNVDPGIVTIVPDVLWVPDTSVDIDHDRRRRRRRR